MSALADELPAPKKGFLRYLRELPSERTWRENSASNAAQWALKFALLIVGVEIAGHGLVVNFAITICWDVGAFGTNLWIWRKNQVCWKKSAARNFSLWPLMQFKNQGLTVLLCSLFGIPIEVAKLMLVPEGIAMNPLMYYINDRFVFAEPRRGAARLRLKLDAIQSSAISRMFLLR